MGAFNKIVEKLAENDEIEHGHAVDGVVDVYCGGVGQREEAAENGEGCEVTSEDVEKEEEES